jgi:hypothetical protein
MSHQFPTTPLSPTLRSILRLRRIIISQSLCNISQHYASLEYEYFPIHLLNFLTWPSTTWIIQAKEDINFEAGIVGDGLNSHQWPTMFADCSLWI